MRAFEEAGRLIVDPVKIFGDQLADLVIESAAVGNGPLDVLVVGNLGGHVSSRLTAVALIPEISAIPTTNIRQSDAPLVIYAEAGTLWGWKQVEQDIAALLKKRPQVVITLVMPQFRRLRFEGHTYILSIFLSCFPRRKFNTNLDVYIAPQTRLPILRKRIPICESPSEFSALVFSITRAKT